MTGANMGGSHVALLLILNNLPNRYKPFFVLDQEGQFSNKLKEQGKSYTVSSKLKIAIHRNIFKKAYQLIKVVWLQYKYIVKNKIDLIHVSDEDLPSIYILAGILSRVPVIWHHHNVIIPTRLNKLCVWLSKYNIFVSQYLKNLSPKVKGNIIYNPIEKPLKTKDRNTQHAVTKIGFFSNLYTRKRADVFIKAISMLYKQHKTFECFVYGDERDLKYTDLKKMLETNEVRKKCTFSLFKSDIQSSMLEMDMIITPAIDEPYGRVLIEAMSLKVPVIASNSAGHKEIIEDNVTGFFFEKDDPADLCHKMLFVINNTQYVSGIVDQAYKRVLEKNGIEGHMELIDSLYKSVLSI